MAEEPVNTLVAEEGEVYEEISVLPVAVPPSPNWNIGDLVDRAPFTSADPAKAEEERMIWIYENFIYKIDRDQRGALLNKWSFWARPNQIAPLGMWTYWLLLAGRGFGKTRTGAEWINERVQQGKAKRIALVAPTAADVRKTMVEGESGLLAISPPWNMPLWEPSKLQLTWPNGAIAQLFSAEEPERLRGPQCLSGDTLVSTVFGPQRIDQIQPGTPVYTRTGVKLITARWMASPLASVVEVTLDSGKSVRCTKDHLFPTAHRGEMKASELEVGDELCVESVLNTGVSATTVTETGIMNTGGRDVSGTPTDTAYTSGFIETSSEKSQGGSMSITGTETEQTIRQSTSNPYQNQTTRKNIGCLSLPRNKGRTGLQRGWQQGRLHRWSMPHANVVALSSSDGVPLALSNGSVRSAVIARPSWDDRSDTLVLASFVAGFFPPKFPSPSAVQIAAIETRCERIVSIKELPGTRPVYDLTVEDDHEFFADGVLVHNCDTFWADELAAWKKLKETWDMLQFGFRLGSDPRGCITTTPKPVEIVKQLVRDDREKGGETAVTRGSTYDNRANLAPKFFQQVVSKYEGTRLGRQELDAEILEDMPGALWQRFPIDALRIPAPTFPKIFRDVSVIPGEETEMEDVAFLRRVAESILKAVPEELSRVIVAVDPNVSNNEGSDEIGITVCGKGYSGKGYVLADCSMRGSPNEWASAAVIAHDAFKADRIIGEANQGGNMIEYTISTSAKSLKENGKRTSDHVGVTLVHATRGKVTRAEPVSALYEQSKIHHVGLHNVLEDQMCLFTSDFDRKSMGYSPDRVDSLVWGLTHLFHEQQEGAGIFDYMRQEAERVKADKLPKVETRVGWVRMKAPPGISHAFGREGDSYIVVDGHIESKPVDVGIFRGTGFVVVEYEDP